MLESELDVGQQFANDYEKSKAAAEGLVRRADFLAAPTIYRPSIIVGDSRTGHTSTFHGFYAPLRIMPPLISEAAPGTFYGDRYLAALGLSGQERKNFVPVDWVAGVILNILNRPEHHGQTYHLTADRGVPMSLVAEAVNEALLRHVAEHSLRRKANGRDPRLEEMFREQMEVYRTYWRGDPEFDHRNTTAAAADLPCPEMDRAMLLRLARFALQVNFGWPRVPPVPPAVNVHEDLRDWLVAGEAILSQGNAGQRLGLQVNGPGGGHWKIHLEQGRVLTVEEGLPAQPAATCYLNSKTWRRLAAGECTAREAIAAGRVLIEGCASEPLRSAAVLQQIVNRRKAPEVV